MRPKNKNNIEAINALRKIKICKHKSSSWRNACKKIITLALPVISSYISKSKSFITDPALSDDDLRQECALDVFLNIKKWKPCRGAWSTFVTLRTRRKLCRIQSTGPLGILPPDYLSSKPSANKWTELARKNALQQPERLNAPHENI
jgi:hypothetical protein